MFSKNRGSRNATWTNQRIAGQLFKLAFLGVMVFCASPCAFSHNVTVESDETLDFSSFKTFVIVSGQMNARAPALNSELTKKRLESEIIKAFTAKGLTASTDHADLNMSFEFGATRIVDTRTVTGPRGLRSRVVNTPESEGTLVIDLHDSSTSALVWHGVVTDAERNPAKLADELDVLVKKVVAKYPPKKKK